MLKTSTTNSVISGVRHLLGRTRGIEMENRTGIFRFTHSPPDGVGKESLSLCIVFERTLLRTKLNL